MATKTKARSRTAARVPKEEPIAGSWQNPPWNTEERLQRIEALGQRIEGYIKYMIKVGSVSGTSAEAKDRAVAAFYERLVIVERQLGSIQEELFLG